jgi:rhamnosyl/mannosyltransferase
MGGIETHLQTLCGELKASVELRVVVANDVRQSVTDVVEDVEVRRAATLFNLSTAPICPRMVGMIRDSKADIVHIHHPNPIAILAYLASGNRGRLVITYHSDIVRQRFLGSTFQPLLDHAMRRCSAVIATSPDYLQTSPTLQTYKDRCEVIPYGIPVDQFSECDPSEVDAIRERYGPRIVISVGRLIYYKGFEYLVDAMRTVDGRLLVLGDGPLRASLERRAAERGVTDRVAFLGEIQNKEIVPYYHAADVFALASVARSEAFGIVQLEAMACGLPVVNTSLDSGVPFVSRHGLTGLTVAPEDPDALAAAINRLFDDRDLRETYGHAARARVSNEFSKEVMAKRTLSLYERIASNAPGA